MTALLVFASFVVIIAAGLLAVTLDDWVGER